MKLTQLKDLRKLKTNTPRDSPLSHHSVCRAVGEIGFIFIVEENNMKIGRYVINKTDSVVVIERLKGFRGKMLENMNRLASEMQQYAAITRKVEKEQTYNKTKIVELENVCAEQERKIRKLEETAATIVKVLDTLTKKK